MARRSLFYLVTYLTLLGGGLFVAPLETLGFLGAEGHYGDTFPRVAGMFLLGLAMITGALIYHRLEVLYGGVVLVRLFFSACFFGFHVQTGDRVFLVFFALVFTGVVLTSMALWVDRGRRAEGA